MRKRGPKCGRVFMRGDELTAGFWCVLYLSIRFRGAAVGGVEVKEGFVDQRPDILTASI